MKRALTTSILPLSILLHIGIRIWMVDDYIDKPQLSATTMEAIQASSMHSPQDVNQEWEVYSSRELTSGSAPLIALREL